jgi:hypothetical protein
VFPVKLGDVEALDAFRPGLKSQSLDQLIQGGPGPPLLEPPSEILQGVLPGQGQDRRVPAILRIVFGRCAQFRLVAELFPEPAEQVSLGRAAGRIDRLGNSTVAFSGVAGIDGA